MRLGKNKPILKAFIFIYVVLSLVLAYLLFFNSGLEIKDKIGPFSGKKEVLLVNNTDRVINNVQVRYKVEGSNEQEYKTFPQLKPREKVKLELGSFSTEKVLVVASAPFHQSTGKVVDFNPNVGKPVTIDIGDAAELGKQFGFTVTVCNYDRGEAVGVMEEIHDPVFFFSSNSRDKITLKAGECQKLEYSLLPSKKGETTIYFNVNFANSSEQLQKSVSVR